jgi:hypothetical protein
VFNYTSKINNSTYMLNTNPMAFEGAESFCNDYGGHLVSYGSKAEQQEVGAGGVCCMCARAGDTTHRPPAYTAGIHRWLG